MHAREVHTYEMHTCEMRSHEMHAHEIEELIQEGYTNEIVAALA
jgi:hypothetical protein